MSLQVSPWIESRWRLVRRVARKDELTLIVLALLVGVLAGVGVVALRLMVDGVQRGAFGVFLERHPARAGDLAWWRPLAVLCIGGLLYGLGVSALLEQRVPKPTARELVRGQTFFVTIDDRLNTALDVFDEAGSDVIAVVQGAQERRVVGLIDESGVLRRYFREAEDLRREELGDVQLRPASARRVVKAES